MASAPGFAIDRAPPLPAGPSFDNVTPRYCGEHIRGQLFICINHKACYYKLFLLPENF